MMLSGKMRFAQLVCASRRYQGIEFERFGEMLVITHTNADIGWQD